MEFCCVNDHGFRRVIGVNDTERCVVSFYPNSPHYDWDWEKATKEESQAWIEQYPIIALSSPDASKYSEWRQAVEQGLEFSELMQEPEDTSTRKKVSELVMQVFFLSGLTIEETSGSLWD